MGILILVTIFTIAIEVCSSQEEVQNTVYYDGGTEYYQQISNYPDGSYRFRIVLHDQQREEEGFYNSKGVWTVRGKVSWLNPSETLNQTILYQADDKGYQVKSSVEELSRKPGRPGESDLPVGPGRPEFPSQPSRPGVPAYPSLPPSYPSQPPSYPSQPPSYPSQPPSYPGTPGYPGAPSAPGYPGSPGGPGYPGFAPPINCGLASICG